MSAFDKLAPFIQEYIWNHRWNELRDVQVKAIDAIMDTPHHVLISAGTAAGKTEAAFFPMLSMVDIHDAQSFSIMYIGPLKALINDQFDRINDLLEKHDYPIYAWHGDRSQAEKKRAMREPKGVLQITPESLEALMMRHPGELKRMLQELQFIVIDEIHAFMGTDRGMQLQCQLIRLDRLIGHPIRRIGLSATINSLEDAAAYLSAGSSLQAVSVQSESGKRQLRISLRHDELLADSDNTAVKQEQNQYLYRQVKGKKCIVFTPSRGRSEDVASTLREYAEEINDSISIYVHHGSVSAALRHEAESAMKADEQPTIAVATKTLELGIDLGHLDKVIQIGHASSCSSFVQRLGRTGRRGTPAVMHFLTEHESGGGSPFDELPMDLLINIAVIQLYVQEHWVEPSVNKPLPYSLLVHQTLSHLMSVNEASPRALLRDVWSLAPFSNITKDDYAILLRNLLKMKLLERMEDGKLIPGLVGERIANHYSFYSVFADEPGYTVIHDQTEIGEIDELPDVGDLFQLAGRTWEVLTTDPDRHKIYVVATSKRSQAGWLGSSMEIDDKIIERIQCILSSDESYPYLLPGATTALINARIDTAQYTLHQWYTILEPHLLLLHPWWGTRKMETLKLILQMKLNKALQITEVRTSPNHIGLWIVTSMDASEFIDRLLVLIHTITSEQLLSVVPGKAIDCYDPFVPVELLKKAYIHNNLDLSGIQSSFDRFITPATK